MTVRSAYVAGVRRLRAAGVESPALDTTLLLGHAMRLAKEQVYAALPDRLEAGSHEDFERLLTRRIQNTPIAYLCGRKEFYGIEFQVDSRVLVPRPETELLVELALAVTDRLGGAHRGQTRLHDMCTGAGPVAICLQKLRPDLLVSASDISADALAVFAANQREQLAGQPIPTVVSDLFCALDGRFDVITANPPYVRDAHVDYMLGANWPEPALALRGGLSGTEVAGRIVARAADYLEPGGALLLEVGHDQAGPVTRRLAEAGFVDVVVSKDLADLDRVIQARRPD